MRGTVKLMAVCALLPILGGCSWFGWGKKSDAVSDTQDPSYDYKDTQGGYQDPYANQPPANAYPVEPAPSSGPRYHTVTKQDTLYSLARQYYGDQAKWRDIYNANRSAIGNPDQIKVGQRLVIP